jgi:hypothetical protein
MLLPKPPANGTPTVVASYANPNSLVAAGPLIKAAWSVPPALADALRASGRPVPNAVPGLLLIDTGATKTCMALQVARELKLNAVGFSKALGAGGLVEHEDFMAHLAVTISDSFGNMTLVEADQRVAGIPELDKSLNPARIHHSDPSHPMRVIGLLGRDFLQHTTLIYHGSRGVVELVLDVRSMPTATQVGPTPVAP